MSTNPPSTTVFRKCHGCKKKLACDQRLMSLPGFTGNVFIVPRFDAPLICAVCRTDAGKLASARAAMMQFFGWTDAQIPVAPIKEL